MRDSSFPTIVHLGAEHCVTGSCHMLQAKGINILVDCGLAQGSDKVHPIRDWPLRASQVDYLFLTHAHIDHVGRLPELIKNGFRGEIIMTHPTKMLLPHMLQDAMHFSDLKDEEIGPLSRAIEDLSWGFEYNETFDLKQGIRFKLGRAGHILGSSFIRFESLDPPWSVLFSGDLGSKDTPILPDPDIPDACDLLILESTYGDTLHGDREHRMERLGAVLTKCLSDGGKVFVPAFALGRTQELIYEMDRLTSDSTWRKRFPKLTPHSRIPVCLDSPLGLEITKVYSNLKPYWDSEAKEILRTGDDPLDFGQLYAAVRFDDHARLMAMKGPAVIIAGSGMCSGGRIVDHLKDGLEDPRNDVLFIGYQAEGSPGRDILRNAGKPGGYVKLEGMRVSIRARIQTLTGYSAHADSRGLLEWVQSMPGKPKRIKLVHGGALARQGLAKKLREVGYQVE